MDYKFNTGETAFTFTAGIVFTLQAMATALFIALAVAVPFFVIWVIFF